MNEIIKQIKKANFIWICGNGGSAATAEHFATDLVKKGYRGMALSANTSVITMIANDYGYDEIFSIQLSNYADKNDLLIVISCSGRSKNIIKAIDKAGVIGMPIIIFENFGREKDYGKLE